MRTPKFSSFSLLSLSLTFLALLLLASHRFSTTKVSAGGDELNFVIIGPAGGGKSSLLRALERRGEHIAIIPEAATDVILLMQAEDSDMVLGSTQFQLEIAKLHHARERFVLKAAKDKIVFSDRTAWDCKTYNEHSQHPPFPSFDQLMEKEKASLPKKYRAVFHLSSLESYKNNAYRRESSEEAKVVGRKILDSYKELGMEVIVIGAGSVDERAEEVMRHVKRMQEESRRQG